MGWRTCQPWREALQVNGKTQFISRGHEKDCSKFYTEQVYPSKAAACEAKIVYNTATTNWYSVHKNLSEEYLTHAC